MSERLFRFKVAELKSVILVCKKCGTKTEMILEKISELPLDNCKCGKEIFNMNENPLREFANAMRNLESVSNHADFEFTLPMDE